jgi:hypothetical protein
MDNSIIEKKVWFVVVPDNKNIDEESVRHKLDCISQENEVSIKWYANYSRCRRGIKRGVIQLAEIKGTNDSIERFLKFVDEFFYDYRI